MSKETEILDKDCITISDSIRELKAIKKLKEERGELKRVEFVLRHPLLSKLLKIRVR